MQLGPTGHYQKEKKKCCHFIVDRATKSFSYFLSFQKHYAEVMAKFRKFQRPVDFEPKLTHVKRCLDEIDERVHLMDIRSEDPESVQRQLDTCMVQEHHLVETTQIRFA